MSSGDEVMYLGEDWLGSTTDGWTDNMSSTVVEPFGNDFTAPANYYTTTYWWPYETKRKIRLKLSEVEHLRKLCKHDRKLRATMEKFAPHIEVEVDFPGGDDTGI